MARQRPQLEDAPNSYFTSEKSGIKFLHTGCTLLDCALGGGYALGRVTNIVGDRSTAKSALATEALINFTRQYPKGKPSYRECEAAYDMGYAEAMGLPLKKIDFGADEPFTTTEDFIRDVGAVTSERIKTKTPGIYVLDSLDSLSDEAEMERKTGEASYGMAKAKLLSEFFRKSARKLERAETLLLVISQVRDNIGAMYGDKQKRSGGKALDFYASQVLWLAHIKTLKKTINKVERPRGVTIRAKVKKNKVGLPFRECDFDFIFGYGIEDVGASVKWLNEVGRLKEAGLDAKDFKAYLAGIEGMSHEEYKRDQIDISTAVRRVWAEVETSFLPKRAKYA